MTSNVLAFSNQTFEIHEVGNRELSFFPISVGALFRFKDFAKPLANALAEMFSSDSNDVGTTIKRRGGETEEVITQAIDPKLAEMRYEQKRSAAESFLEIALSDKTAHSLGAILMDSLREEFPPGSKKPDAKEWVKSLPAEILMEMLAGLAKANKKLLDPLVRAGLLSDPSEAGKEEEEEIETPGSFSKTT